jgi:hypothetical protein
LIGGGDKQETSSLELAQQWGHRLVHMEFLHRQGTNLVLAFHPNPIQYPVPFNKNALHHAFAKA